MTVLDVGAHIGLFALPIARAIGPTGHVHAVEPDEVNRAKLLRHIEMNPEITWLTVHSVAVSDTREGLHVDSPTPHNRSPRISRVGLSVEAVTLDDLDVRADLIKMDIEGYETKALAGASRTLANRPVMFVEVEEALLREAGSSASELLGALNALSYRAVDRQTGEAAVLPIAATDVICEAE